MTFLIEKGRSVSSGDSNGLTIHIDTEAYDHGYAASAGPGVSVVVHHHADKPIFSSGTTKLMVWYSVIFLVYVDEFHESITCLLLLLTQVPCPNTEGISV